MQAALLDVDTALLTDRTVVRRFRENDGSAFFVLLQDNHTRLIEHFPELIRQISDKDQGEFYIRRKISNWLLQKEFAFGIWEHDSAALIGMIHLYQIEWQTPKALVSFFIDQHFAGRGLMTESLAVAVRFAFRQLKIEKLCLRTATDNYAAQRLARKSGFRREGDLREEFRRSSGELIDVMLFGLTRSEYERV